MVYCTPDLTPSTRRTGGPARYMKVEETGGTLGFITPLSHTFCEACNRVRVTCTGQLFLCLGQDDQADLRQVLRDHPGDDAPLREAIRTAIGFKPRGHDFRIDRPGAAPAVISHRPSQTPASPGARVSGARPPRAASAGRWPPGV